MSVKKIGTCSILIAIIVIVIEEGYAANMFRSVNAYSGNYTFENPDGTLGVYNKTEKCQYDANYAACVAAFEEMEKAVSTINELIKSAR